MAKTKLYNNVVPSEIVRDVQRRTLDVISKSLKRSFGPMGSITAIVKSQDSHDANIEIEYTKDGHTIIKNTRFLYPIERSVQDILTELTRYVVKEVGDGTTSAIILCKTVFDALCESSNKYNQSSTDLFRDFNKVIQEISKRILSKAKECTLEDIYNIALISTNDNEEMAGMIYQIYKKYGMDVFIDVGISTQADSIVKEYDGMTLETGFADICMVNMKSTNSAVIENPKIYFFNDPIDTPEMIALLNTIVEHNILRAYRQNSMYEPIPTVIMCKYLTPDTSSYFESVVQLMNQIPGIPLLIISDIHQDYILEDIAKMCGGRFIKKYINRDIQEKDIEAGLAPNAETIIDFCGTAERVEADQLKTKVIHPAKAYNKDGSYSDEYKGMLNYLENQVQKAISEDAGISHIAETKRRLNSFKGNMVDFLVGGITNSDREALRSAAEDAILNCRSATVNGVGYGANFMAYQTITEMLKEPEWSRNTALQILQSAYVELIKTLYSTSNHDDELDDILKHIIEYGCPLNIKTNQFDRRVLSSIKSDIVVLETIDKILTKMFTTNQYLVQSPAHNIYLDYKLDESDEIF